MHCEKALELMSAALDGEITAAERNTLDVHLASCPNCRELFEELAGQSRLLRELDCEVPEGLSARILAALPQQKSASKKSPIVYLRRWGALAACLVLVVCGAFALPDLLDRSAMDAALVPVESGAPAAADYSVRATESETYESLITIPAEVSETAAISSDAETTAEDAVDCETSAEAKTTALIRAVRYERIDWSETLTASAALIDSAEALDAFHAQYPGVLAPDTDLTAAQFIAVTLSESSGSVSHEVEDVRLTDGGCEVVIRRQAPEVGTCDMAGWLILIEVDPVFTQQDTLTLTLN